jgi:ferric iron reductase protein FhuF
MFKTAWRRHCLALNNGLSNTSCMHETSPAPMIALLAPLFQGEWAAYGETLACAPRWPAEAIPVARLCQDTAMLRQTIARYAARLGVDGDGGADLRPAASAWSLDYLGALLAPAAAAASVLQHAFPLGAADLALTLDRLGAPARFHLVDQGRALPGSPTLERYGPLLREHLAPLFEAIGGQTRLPPKILWANAARKLDEVLVQALALTGGAPRVGIDRDQLLHRQAHADGGANPLYGRPSPLHRHCCLRYQLPGQSYCGACPHAAHRP